MTDSRREIDALFDEALDLPTEERPAFLDRQEISPEVREAVERLLEASEDTLTILPSGGALGGALGREIDTLDKPLFQGERVGAYRIVRELGRGGMAVVYLAARADGAFEQEVALKVIQAATHDTQAVRRFHLERQILASLDHPHIARLLDGGLTEHGRPFFVMEMVEGLAIDRYCDDHRLSIEERLALFVQAARAVESAHRALVVHRDIKPSNILVTRDGCAKLLDFGIAKVLADDVVPEAPEPVLTGTLMRVMTPEYASPEQFRGDLVTTASDVYQLGVLLYELLTGHRPFELRGLSPSEAEAMVCRQPPALPSAAVVSPIERPPAGTTRGRTTSPEEIGRLRRASPEALRKTLLGDLDTIVLTALRKEPERRYGSVEQLAEDVESYLEGRPVRARRDSVAYRVGKLLRRHAAVAGAAAAVAVVLAGLSTYYTVELRHERDAARLEARQALEARDRAEASRDEAEVARRDAEAVAAGVAGLARDAGGSAPRFGPRHLELAARLVELARKWRGDGRLAEAEAGLRLALEIREAVLGAGDPGVERTREELQELLQDAGLSARAAGVPDASGSG